MRIAPSDRGVLLDTSAVIPLLVSTHAAHTAVARAARGRRLVLAAHSLAESYSVLTRFPGSSRTDPKDAVRVIDATFADVVPIGAEEQRGLHRRIAAAGIVGGAVYDALVALAAIDNELPVLSRDSRALGTYAALGAQVHLI